MIFLKEKRDETIKSRICIDGLPQREYICKEDASSPTVATESVFITSAIDAHEGRNVAFANLPGAFLHTAMDDKVIVLLSGELCEPMVKVDPTLYQKYVMTTKNGKPVF